MPNGAHAHLSTRPARNGEPQPAPPPNGTEPGSARRDLASWWKQFSKPRAVKKEEEKEPEHRGIFGVPLIVSIPYANVAISLFHETGESYIYGYVPIVVAKCGVYLKEKATDIEGIFRLAGSEKRIKELKLAFDTPPRYGKGLDWNGYTVHDAANILRRYFNQLPEPIIPLQHYDPFRQPLRGHQAEAVGPIEGQAPSVGGFDAVAAVRLYQQFIKELPSLNRQLLLYILDLLAVFAAKSDVNKMTTSNLAAIFQPGILSHPQHDMSPRDYRLSQDVLIFLIDNQDHFLIGMEGTAVDEGTVKHVESGPSTPTRTPSSPGRSKSGLGRSASAASSAGADSLRKGGGIRRNVSTSSKHSRLSNAIPSPTTPIYSTPSASGIHRSNTLPSKKSPHISAARFPRDTGSDSPTPALEAAQSFPLSAPPRPTEPNAAQSEQPPRSPLETFSPEVLDVVRPQSIELPRPTPTDVPGAYPLPTPEPPTEDARPMPPAAAVTARELAPPLSVQTHGQRSPHLTPTRERSRERSDFIEGPIDTGTPVEITPAVRTFTQILSKVSPTGDEKREGRKPNKLQKKQKPSLPSAHSSTHSLTGGHDKPPSPLHGSFIAHYNAGSSKDVLQSHKNDTGSSRNSGATLKPSTSPSGSLRSHSTATEYSEAEHAEEHHKEEKHAFWRNHKRGESKATPTASRTDLTGSVPGAGQSMSSFGSGSNREGRRSLQHDSPTTDSSLLYGSPPQEKKGALSWFQHKRQELHKDREAKKQRAKSPPGSSSDLIAQQTMSRPNAHESLPSRGRSMDHPGSMPSEENKGSNDTTPTGPTPNPITALTPATPVTPAPPTVVNGQRPVTPPSASAPYSPVTPTAANSPHAHHASQSPPQPRNIQTPQSFQPLQTPQQPQILQAPQPFQPLQTPQQSQPPQNPQQSQTAQSPPEDAVASPSQTEKGVRSMLDV